MKEKVRGLIWEWLLVAALLVLFGCITEVPEAYTADGELYKGLAENLLSGKGYHDTIRNDFILPTIGHPALIAGFKSVFGDQPQLLAIMLLVLSLLLGYLTAFVLKVPKYLRVLVLPFIYWCIPVTYEWGVEMSLAFSTTFLFAGLAVFIQRRTWWTMLLLSLALILNLLIRPVILPLCYVALLAGLVSLIKRWRVALLPLGAVAIALLVIQCVGWVSQSNYGDKRLVTGTYSAIPLYSANNKYLDLQTNYYSTNWKKLPPELSEEALAPLELETTWQDRHDTLMNKVVHFVKAHPGKAIAGWFWRFRKFTFQQANSFGNWLFWGWLLLCSGWVYSKRKGFLKNQFFLKLLILFSPLVVTAVTACFPYVGARYNLTPNLYFIFSLILILSFWAGWLNIDYRGNENR